MGTSVNTSGMVQYAIGQFSSPVDASMFSLSPDALLTYCQTRLQSLDGDIKQYMDNQRTQLAKKEVLQNLETVISDHNTVNKKSEDLPKLEHAIANAYAKAYKNLKAMGMDDEAAALKSAFKEVFPNGDITKDCPSIKGSKIPTSTQSAFDKFTQPLQDMVDEIGKNAELNMIQLQSIMSQRQTAVQLTTNMMAKLNGGYDAVTANIGK